MFKERKEKMESKKALMKFEVAVLPTPRKQGLL